MKRPRRARLYLIGDLVTGYAGISSPDVAGQIAHVLYSTSNELRNGRPVPIEVRRAVRGLADVLRRELAPRSVRQ